MELIYSSWHIMHAFNSILSPLIESEGPIWIKFGLAGTHSIETIGNAWVK